MDKQTYIKLPNITVSDLQKVVDYLDENNIKYIEYFKEENKLEQALNEIENILNGVCEMASYSKIMCLFEEDIKDIEKIIQKTKVGGK